MRGNRSMCNAPVVHARFLVAEHEASLARDLAHRLAEHGGADVVASRSAAIAALASGHYAAVLVDAALSHGAGFAVAAAARAHAPGIPVLILAGDVNAQRLADAYALGADYLVKPLADTQLAVFAERARSAVEPVERVTDQWRQRYGLTGAETAILLLAARGTPRRALAAERGVAAGTVKKQVQHLLDKTGDAKLDDAVGRVLRDALASR
jgi:DNA-binding NarL/FixJ family response regulator